MGALCPSFFATITSDKLLLSEVMRHIFFDLPFKCPDSLSDSLFDSRYTTYTKKQKQRPQKRFWKDCKIDFDDKSMTI